MIRRRCFVILSILTIFMALLVLVSGYLYSNPIVHELRQDSVRSAGSWRVACNGWSDTYSLPAHIKNKNKAPVLMEKELPASFSSSCMMLYTTQSEVSVTVNGKTVYQTSNRTSHSRIKPPSMYHLVPLPSWEGDARIVIRILPTLLSEADEVPAVWFGRENALAMSVVKASYPALSCTIILLALSGGFFVYGLFSAQATVLLKKRMRIFSYLLTCVCIWCLFESPMKQFLLENYMLCSLLREVSFYLIPVFLSRYFFTFEEVKRSRLNLAALVYAYGQFFFVQIAIMRGLEGSLLNPCMQIATAFVLISALYVTVKSDPDSELRQDLKPYYFMAAGFLAELVKTVFITKALPGLIILIFTIICVAYYLYTAVYKASEEYVDVVKENYEIREELQKTEVNLMMAQIRPHFLYNTLTAIQTIIKVNPDYAYDLMFDFSRFLRSSIKSISDEAIITLREEIKNIDAYLNIEKMRLGDVLTVVYDVRVEDIPVAPLSIQPLVENAVKHGPGEESRPMKITISSYETEEDYVIEVCDTGVGFDTDILGRKEDSVGFSNIKFRLEKQMHARIYVQSNIGEGTTCKVCIPKYAI